MNCTRVITPLLEGIPTHGYPSECGQNPTHKKYDNGLRNTAPFFRIKHEFAQEPDFFTTTGERKNVSDTVPLAAADHGDWGFNNATKTLSYLVSGKGVEISPNYVPNPRNIQLRVCP